MSTHVRHIDHADGADRPYSAATIYNGLVFPCGQVPIDSVGGVPDGLRSQIFLAFDNLERVLVAAGSSLDDVLQLTVYLADLSSFDEYNDAYLDRLSGYRLPPRTTIQVAAFRGEKKIEISAIAAQSGSDRYNDGSTQ